MKDYHGIDLRIANATRAELQSLVDGSDQPVIVMLAKRELASRERFAQAAAKAVREKPTPVAALIGSNF